MIVVLVIAGFVANSITLDQYVLSPGSAQSVAPLIKLPAGRGHASQGDILLTDVYLTQVRALEWPLYQLNSDDAVYAGDQLFNGPTKPSQIQQDEALQMVFSSDLARVVALRQLGFTVPERTGAIVLQVLKGSPAAKLGDLEPGDAITAIDATPVASAAAAVTQLQRHRPGQAITLSVRHVDGAAGPETLTLGAKPGHPSAPLAGVGIATSEYFQLPFRVEINSDGIGGPSAGLAFTLGIIDQLAGGQLTGGHRVAATGTISLDGKVGQVGGVPQKTIAVNRAGATAFLVPTANYHDALSKAGPGLDVIPVANLTQALAALRHLGGHLPPAPAPAHSPTTAPAHAPTTARPRT